MKTQHNNTTNANEVFNEMVGKVTGSPFFRIVLFFLVLVPLFHHLHFFYDSVWHQKGVSTLWAVAHLGISIYLLLQKDAFNDLVSSGYITIFLLGLTYALHSGIFVSFWGDIYNKIAMKSLIIIITLGGVFSIAHTFKK